MMVFELIEALERHDKNKIVYVGECIPDATDDIQVWEKTEGTRGMMPEGVYIVLGE